MNSDLLGLIAESIEVELPGTTVLSQGRLLSARLRRITGRDELYIQESADMASPGLQPADLLLQRCVVSLRFEPTGEVTDVAPLIGALTLGDREALLLRMRLLNFGNRLNLVVNCPAPDCSEPMDVSLTIAEICCAREAEAYEDYTLVAESRPLRFRLPTQADVRAAALSRGDPAAAMAWCCLLNSPSGLSPAELEALGTELSSRDPQAEVELELSCPECGHGFTAALHADRMLQSELASRRTDFETGVSLMAMHYHWSEREILDLPISRRRRYVSALMDALSDSGGLE